jgi:5-methyltetrahydrofolate--homocysteine methyltransferase
MADENEILGRLRDAIVTLDIPALQQACEEVIVAGIPAHRAVIEGMAKGMEIVGEKYEDGEYYLAELIMAGETMREGMVVLEPHLTAGELSRAGKAVIGTVKGDLHDIGKNVFLTLLRAANYDVIDLGVDVSPEGFLEAVKEHNPDILAMSALLTTTMVEMENIVSNLESAGVREGLKILIGGAPINDEYAQKIGADAAARDAVDGVRIVSQWMSSS